MNISSPQCNATRETGQNIWLCVAECHPDGPDQHYMVPMIRTSV